MLLSAFRLVGPGYMFLDTRAGVAFFFTSEIHCFLFCSRRDRSFLYLLIFSGFKLTDHLMSYPNWDKEQVLAALEYAADIITNEESIETE